MSHPDYSRDEELDAELRAVPLPDGFMERLHRAALSDETLDAAVRAVPVPPALDRSSRPGRLPRHAESFSPMRRARQWTMALSLLLILGLTCVGIMAGLLVVATMPKGAPFVARAPGKAAEVAAEKPVAEVSKRQPKQIPAAEAPAEQSRYRSWLAELDERFGPGTADPLSGQPSPQWKGMFAWQGLPVETPGPAGGAEVNWRDIEPLVAGAGGAARPAIAPTSRTPSNGAVAPLSNGTSTPEPMIPLPDDAKSPPPEKPPAETINFDSGVTLFEEALLLPPGDRAAQLLRAGNCFRKFLALHPDHPSAIRANTYLANLLIEQGRIKMAEADRPTRTSPPKEQLLREARGLYLDAQKILGRLSADLAEKQRPSESADPGDAKLIAEREQTEREALVTEIVLSKLEYEMAQTYEPGSKENQERLEAAANLLDGYYRKYAPRPIALYARIDQARCCRELGQPARALALLQEVLSQAGESEGFRGVREAARSLAKLTPEMQKKSSPSGTENTRKEP